MGRCWRFLFVLNKSPTCVLWLCIICQFVTKFMSHRMSSFCEFRFKKFCENLIKVFICTFSNLNSVFVPFLAFLIVDLYILLSLYRWSLFWFYGKPQRPILCMSSLLPTHSSNLNKHSELTIRILRKFQTTINPVRQPSSFFVAAHL